VVEVLKLKKTFATSEVDSRKGVQLRGKISIAISRLTTTIEKKSLDGEGIGRRGKGGPGRKKCGRTTPGGEINSVHLFVGIRAVMRGTRRKRTKSEKERHPPNWVEGRAGLESGACTKCKRQIS